MSTQVQDEAMMLADEAIVSMVMSSPKDVDHGPAYIKPSVT